MPNEKKLRQLAALQQLAGPQQDPAQAQSQRMHAALQMMGLMQQGQEGEAQRAFQERQLAQSGQQFDATLAQRNAAEQNRQGEYWGGTLPLQYTEQGQLEAHRKAQEVLAQNTFNDESGYRWGVKAPLDWAKQATDDRTAAGALAHYDTLNRKALADSYMNLDPMGNGPKVAGSILGGDPLVGPAMTQVNAANQEEEMKRYKALLAMDPNSPAVPPEIRAQLLGQVAGQNGPATVPSTTTAQGLLPAIGNSFNSAVSSLWNLPSQAAQGNLPFGRVLFGDAGMQDYQQRAQQGGQQLEDFTNQLLFGSDPKARPNLKLSKAKQDAIQRKLQQLTPQ